MRPYKHKQRRKWRTRSDGGFINDVRQYLKPFLLNLNSLWKLGPPFPVSGKVTMTVLTWILLLLPLFYFLVPPMVTIFLINYFSERWNYEEVLKKVGEICACAVGASKFRRAALYLWKTLDRITVLFFLYDYYQILKYLRDF